MSEVTVYFQQVLRDYVAERGYRDGYTAEQYLRRQALKLVEETAELVAALGALAPADVRVAMEHAARAAREWFDAGYPAGETEPPAALDAEALEHVADELADVQVVVFVAAEALTEIRGKQCDIVRRAVWKAAMDRRRGVR